MPSPPVGRKRVLVFEPDTEGHSLEWLEHLTAFVSANQEMEIWLVVAQALRAALDRSLSPEAAARIRVMTLTPREQRLCTARVLSLAAFARWWTMRRYLRLSGAEEGFFLTLDLLSLPLALGLGARGRSLSGILFRPSVHYTAFGRYTPSRGERLRDFRKNFLYSLMLRNPALSRVLSLDPFFPVYARSHYRHGEKVLALPDPAHPPTEPALSAGAGGTFVPAGRIGFLLFGYLAERKGPLVVLEALRLLPASIARRVAVLFAGKIDPDLRSRIEQRRRGVAALCPELWLHIENRRLDRAELAALVSQTDVVLAPYQRFVGSSGVLLWAARAGRPVLAQEFGLVGELTRRHRLGIAVDASDPAAIAREIVHMIEAGPLTFLDRPSAARFAASHTPQRFASLVLSV